jgi:hypothetical protein
LGAMANLGVAPPEAPGNPSCSRVLQVGGDTPGRSIVSGMMPGRVLNPLAVKSSFERRRTKDLERAEKSKPLGRDGPVEIVGSRHGAGRSTIDKDRIETGGDADTHGFINVNPTNVVVSHEGRKDKIGSSFGDMMIVVNLGFLARGLGTEVRPSTDVALGNEEARESNSVHGAESVT